MKNRPVPGDQLDLTNVIAPTLDDDRGLQTTPTGPAQPPRRSPVGRQLATSVIVGAALGLVALAAVVGLRSMAPDTPAQSAPPRAVQTSAAAVQSAEPTATPTPYPTTGFLDTDELKNAWDYDVATFPRPMPDGYTFPGLPDGYTEGSDHWEAGITSIVVATTWACAWESAYLEAASQGVPTDESTVAAQAAMKQIDAFQDLPAVKSHFPDAAKWATAVVDPAKQGDLSAMRDDVSGTNCLPLVRT